MTQGQRPASSVAAGVVEHAQQTGRHLQVGQARLDPQCIGDRVRDGLALTQETVRAGPARQGGFTLLHEHCELRLPGHG